MSVYCYRCPECGRRYELPDPHGWLCEPPCFRTLKRDYQAEAAAFARSTCRAVSQ